MAQQKLPLKDIHCNRHGREIVWDELSEDEQKQVSFWLMNRYVSSVKGNREKQELAVFKTNEYYNKNYMEVSKHPKLQWQLLCQTGNTGKIEFPTDRSKKKAYPISNSIKFLQQLFPT